MSDWIASAMPGYWIFTATSRPSASVARCTWPIDAAAMRLLVEVGERLRERLAEIRLGDLADGLERDGLGRVLKLGQDLLHLGPELLGHEPEVDGRERLPHLHRGAPHPAQDLDELVGGLELLAVRRLLALLR